MSDHDPHPETAALHHRVDTAAALPTVTPVYQTSAFEAGSPYFYTRKDNPNVAELEGALARLEGAPHAIATTCGMSALALALSLLPRGARLVVHRLVYGCSMKLFQRLTQRLGATLDVVDLSDPSVLERLRQETSMVLFETPTNPFLHTLDIRRIATAARAANPDALVVVDNTWATSLFQRPLDHGADVSLHSATKFVSGHSDVMGGLLLARDATLAEAIRSERFYTGAILDPHSAWLLRRSLQTLPLRMQAHVATTRRLSSFLADRPEVAEVFLPTLDDTQLRGYGGILFFRLAPAVSGGYDALASRLALFSTGTAMACVTSMIAQPFSGSHASLTAEEKAAMGLGPDLVRLCFGLERTEDLEADLADALDGLSL